MNKTMTMATIVLVAVVMGISSVAPMMPQAEAAHGETIPQEACDALEESKAPQVQKGGEHKDHCPRTPPP